MSDHDTADRGPPGEVAQGETRTVLVADDLPQVRRLIRVTLSATGCEVLEAENGERAVAVARESYPDLILMDLAMPKRTGLWALARLREDPLTAGIPVVILTANDEETAKETAESLGAIAYLLKPFRPLQLLAIVDQALAPTR